MPLVVDVSYPLSSANSIEAVLAILAFVQTSVKVVVYYVLLPAHSASCSSARSLCITFFFPLTLHLVLLPAHSASCSSARSLCILFFCPLTLHLVLLPAHSGRLFCLRLNRHHRLPTLPSCFFDKQKLRYVTYHFSN